jgi:hypothetical protein
LSLAESCETRPHELGPWRFEIGRREVRAWRTSALLALENAKEHAFVEEDIGRSLPWREGRSKNRALAGD